MAATRSQGFVGSQLPGNPFKIEFVRGGRGRAEYRYPAGDGAISLTVFDGTYLWEYHALGNQYTKTPAAAWTFQGEIATIDLGRRPANILAASYQEDERIDFRGNSVDCYVVLVQYSRGPGLLIRDVMRRVWISKDSELILRDYWEGADGMATVRSMVTTNYTDIETNIPMPDDLFVFQPPAGSKMAPPQVLGGIVGGISPLPGTLQRKVAPEYTEDARAAELQGSVILSIEVDPGGRVQNPMILYPLGMGLNEKASAAVGQWQYTSTTNLNGSRRRRVVEVPFRLKPAGPWVLDALVYNTQSDGGAVAATQPELRQYSAPGPAVCSAQGYVEVDFRIGADGVPLDIQIASDAPGDLGDGVLKAVRSWRFRPFARSASNGLGTTRALLECRPGETLAAAGPIYSRAVVEPPALLFRLDPEYSEEARKAKLQGQVKLSLVVQTDGKTSGVQVIKPLGMGLDEQAIAAVMHWRFKPGTKDGRPVRVAEVVTVSFSLP